MRRGLAATLCALAAIAAPAALAATAHDYRGIVDGGGRVHLRVKRAGGVRRLVRFDFRRVDLTCNGHHHTATGNLDFAPRIRHGSFAFRARNGRGGTIRVAGELKHHGRRATGRIRLRGTLRVNGDGIAHHCDSHRRHWTARRR
jgi:hypothetical protein